MKNLLIILMFLNISACALLNPNPNRTRNNLAEPLILKEFSSDYCSEWPDGRIDDPKLWATCCFAHDLSYWIGGTEQDRLASDKELKVCVRNSSDSLNGFLMYTGVRIGGDPGEASYAWGYGWTHDRKYFQLSKDDKERAKTLLQSSNYNKDEKEKKVISSFIEKKLK